MWISSKSASVYVMLPFQHGQVFQHAYRDGTGDVIFDHKWEYNKFFHVDLPEEDGVFGLPNAKDVEKRLKELARQMSAYG